MNVNQRCLHSGFTLLEILLAIFIFSIMATTLFGSFNRILGSADIIEENLMVNEMAKICLDRMILDLREIRITHSLEYVKPEIDSDPDIHRVVGQEFSEENRDFPRLRFTSAAHVTFGRNQPAGVAEIIYYVSESNQGRIQLKRSDRLDFSKPVEADNQDPVLCENVRALGFTYYDKDGQEYKDWDSESSEYKYETPVSIGIRLEIGSESNSSVYRTRIQLPVYRAEQQGAST